MQPCEDVFTVEVEVTAADITAARLDPFGSCAVERAVRRAGFPAAAVASRGAWLAGEDAVPFGTLTPLPAEAVAWIERFDGGHPVEPVTFQLPVVARPCAEMVQ